MSDSDTESSSDTASLHSGFPEAEEAVQAPTSQPGDETNALADPDVKATVETASDQEAESLHITWTSPEKHNDAVTFE